MRIYIMLQLHNCSDGLIVLESSEELEVYFGPTKSKEQRILERELLGINDEGGTQ